TSMHPKSNRRLAVFVLAATLIAPGCTPKATPPPVDAMATAVAHAAFELLTQTAAAASPTPPPTQTFTPSPTPQPPTPTSSEPPKRPKILVFTGCWYGPGLAYTLESNISAGKRVDLLGIGSEPGWYIIRNPYFHKPCWVKAADLEIDPATDIT